VHLKNMDAAMEPGETELIVIVDAVRRRDQESFTRLVAAYDRDLLRLAYVVTGSREAGEDAAQATWERLWHKPPNMRDASKLHSWLLKVCANEARQAGRRRRRGAALEASMPARTAGEDRGVELADLRSALAGLTLEERELLGLRFAVGMPSAQIGEHLGLSPEGARTRLHRLLQRLRQELTHD
jgi:RNA polymerase sigma-70 factor (ECF subfamily)